MPTPLLCITCGQPYDFMSRWNTGARLSRFGAQNCSDKCFEVFAALSDDEQTQKGKQYLQYLETILPPDVRRLT